MACGPSFSYPHSGPVLPLCALSGVPFTFLLSSYRDPAQPRHTWVEAFGVGGVIPTLKDRYETQPALSLSLGVTILLGGMSEQ